MNVSARALYCSHKWVGGIRDVEQALFQKWPEDSRARMVRTGRVSEDWKLV